MGTGNIVIQLHWIKLSTFLILYSGSYKVETATLVASVSPSPAVKGVSSPHSVQCNYTLSSGEGFQFIQIQAADNQIIAEFTQATKSAQWASSTAADSLRPRGNLSASVSLQYLTMTLRDTQCSDNNQTYQCRLQYTANNGNSILFNVTTTVVTVEAAPLAPVMKVIPASDNATEFTNMTFECEGNVGRPAGTFQWYIFTGSGPGQEVTDQAQNLAETASGDGCTFSRKSQLIWNMTRIEENKRFVVRCRVNHPTQGNQDTNACSDANVDFCRMSPEINIQYPVSVSVASDTMTAYEGKDLTINCSTDGNPDPYRIDWQKEGENETLPSSDGALTLNNVTSDDQGSYICTAYNTIEGSSRQASATVLVTVEKITTSTSTITTTTPTPSTVPGSISTQNGNNAVQQAGAGKDNLKIIIPVVVGAVVIIIVVIIIVVVVRRRNRKKEVEEPPEKPFNNNAGINTLATKPDLVDNHKPASSSSNPDGLIYAELQFDNKPRSRRPLAIDDSRTDYSSVSMPQV